MVGEGTNRRSADADGRVPVDRERRSPLDRLTGRLPTGRATVGAVLIVLAATGVLVAHRAASQPPTTRYVVAARDVPAGQVLTADDLGTLAADLPTGVTSVAADRADQLIGQITRSPLGELDLVRPSDVVAAASFIPPGSVEVPVEIDAARALPGAIRSGSRVDVLSTDPDEDGTVVLARDVLVVDVGGDEDSEAIGGTGGVPFRLAAPDADAATAIVDAAVRSQVTLVLPTSADDDG